LDGNLPERLTTPPEFVASALQWILSKYLLFNNPVLFIQSHAEKIGHKSAQWYLQTLGKPLAPLFNNEASFSDQIRLLQAILKAAKYERLWLTVDGLERWAHPPLSEQVKDELGAVLSTLAFFDMPGISFKFFLPLSFENVLHKTGGVERHRAFEAKIEWNEESLQAVLETRVKRALASEKISLSTLCDIDTLLKWLKEYGGNSPRGWLELAAPLALTQQKPARRLNPSQTLEMLYCNPPPLQLSHERQEVKIGNKPVSLAGNEFRLMKYLCSHLREICSLEEIYYYTYREIDEVPDKGDKQWEHPDDWRGSMDTLLWRVRQKIEPNPSNPIYLVTRRGKGLELLHANL